MLKKLGAVWKALRWVWHSNLLLAVVAIQVFVQVWMHVLDAPFTGLIICLWLSFKLGCLAGYADITQVWVDGAQEIATDIHNFQTWFDSLPAPTRLAHAEDWAVVMRRLTDAHQQCVAIRDRPYEPRSMLSFISNPLHYFARPRARKILATAEVQHG